MSKKKKKILSFDEVTMKNIDQAGGKGASLGEMTQNKFQVPPGFVVTAQVFKDFVHENDIASEIDKTLKTVNPKDTETVEHAAEVIRHLIKELPFPKELEKQVLADFKKLGAKFVAVRSSATAEDSKIDSWAGELDTFLNTTEETLIKNIKLCWASLFTPRAIFYRIERNMGGKEVLVAVVVQKMVESEVSGVAFSVHPVLNDKNKMCIEACYGLGEALVSGQVTPDNYVVEKEMNLINDVMVAEQTRIMVKRADNKGNEWKQVAASKKDKQKITGKVILELADLVKRIEKHYGEPMDVEWAYEKGQIYLVQARPITALQ